MAADRRIAPIATVPLGEIEALLDTAFGTGRRQRTAYLLREGVRPLETLSLVMLEGSLLVGSVQSWPILLAGDRGERRPLTLVGPVAVAPDRQNQGIGRALLTQLLAVADRSGAPPQLLIGDAPYYGPFGFDAARTGGWRLPGPGERDRLLLRCPLTTRLPVSGRLMPDRTG